MVKTEAGSTPSSERSRLLKSASPLDYHIFRQEITSKYPAYNPPPPPLPLELEQNSMLPPLPSSASQNATTGSSTGLGPASVNNNGGSIIHQPVHIATPAPSPPPSPIGPGGKAGKKQNYQTNQNFPFLYPPFDGTPDGSSGLNVLAFQEYIATKPWGGRDVPVSILEAGEIFAGRMETTRAVKQLWDERERFMRFERGWENTLSPSSGMSPSGEGDPQSNEEDPPTNPDVAGIVNSDVRQRLLLVEDFYVRHVIHHSIHV